MRIRTWVAVAAAGAVLLSGLPGFAEPPAAGTAPGATQSSAKSQALVRRYLAAIKFEALMDTMFQSLTPLMVDNMAQQYPSLTADQRQAIGETVREVMRDDIMPKMIDRMTPIYASTFSESELEAMVAFYESPAGRAVTEKAPSLAPKVTEVTRALMPEMQIQTVKRLCAKIDCTQKKPAAKPRAS